MRRALALSATLAGLMLVISGCGGPSTNKGKLEGTSWGSEETKYSGTRVPAGHLKLYFWKDGRMAYHVAGQVYMGRYTFGSGDIVNFELDRELAGSKSHKERIWFEDDRMFVSDILGPKISFRKLK